MGANKKHRSASHAAAKSKKQQTKSQDGVSTSSTTTTATTTNNNKKGLSQPQLTAIVFFAFGVSRLLEWKRAVHELSIPSDDVSSTNDTTDTTTTANAGGGLCEAYLLQDTNSPDSILNNICHSSVTVVLMNLRLDTAFQIMALVTFLILKTWNNPVQLDHFNGILMMVPVSTTLLLVQIHKQILATAKVRSITLACITLAAVASSATVKTIQDTVRIQWESQKAYNRQPRPIYHGMDI